MNEAVAGRRGAGDGGAATLPLVAEGSQPVGILNPGRVRGQRRALGGRTADGGPSCGGVVHCRHVDRHRIGRRAVHRAVVHLETKSRIRGAVGVRRRRERQVSVVDVPLRDHLVGGHGRTVQCQITRSLQRGDLHAGECITRIGIGKPEVRCHERVRRILIRRHRVVRSRRRTVGSSRCSRSTGRRTVSGTVHRTQLEAVGRPVGQAGDHNAGLVCHVTTVVRAVRHVRPTTPIRGAAQLIPVLVLGQCRSARTVTGGAPVQRHLSIPGRSGKGGGGLQRLGVVHPHTGGRLVTVAGGVRGYALRHVQRHRRAVIGWRDGGRPHHPRVICIFAKGRGRTVAHRHVPHHEVLHRLAEGERGGKGARRTPAGHIRGDRYRRRRVVHLVGVGRPVRQRGCQPIAGRVLNVLPRVKSQRHRGIEIGQVATAGGHVIGGSRAAHRCHGYVRAADARTRDGEVRVVHVHHRLAEGYPPHQTVGIGLPTAMGALTGDGRYRRRYGVGGAGDGAKDCSGKAVPGAAHRPHLEIINCPVGQTGDRKAGLVVEGLVTVAVGHVSPPDPR